MACRRSWRFVVGADDGGHVMPVDDDDVPAEGFPARAVGGHVVLEHGGAALAQAVDIDDGDEVVELVVGGHRGRFPHRALGGLAVAHHHVDALVALVELGHRGHAHADRQALAERAGGDVHERQRYGGMALEIGVDLTQVQQIVTLQVAGFGPGGVEHRRCVALREDEDIVGRIRRILGIVAHGLKEQRRHQLGRGGASGGVAAAGGAGGSHRIDAHLCGFVFQTGQDFWGDRHSVSKLPFQLDLIVPVYRVCVSGRVKEQAVSRAAPGPGYRRTLCVRQGLGVRSC